MQGAAEPLSEDEFEREAKQDAKQYLDRLEPHNSRKRKDRHAPISIRKQKDSNRTPFRPLRSGSSSSQYDSDLDHSPIPFQSKGKARERGPFHYEGQIILNYNPLERLAGLRNGTSHDDEEERSVKEELSVYTVTSPLRDQSAPSEDYEEEDEVVAPWTALVVKDEPLSISANGEDGGDHYSDEDFFDHALPTSPYGVAGPSTLDSLDHLPSRPDFGPVRPDTPSQSLLLDLNEPDIRVPASINRYLKEYQREGTRFLFEKYQKGSGGILGDDMGLGKTIQVISFLSAIMRKSGTSEDESRRKRTIRRTGQHLPAKAWPTALIVCPKFLLRNWQRELDTWGYFETALWQTDSWHSTKTSLENGYLDIILTSYETARMTIDHLKDLPISVVIADEAHRMKEPRAAISLALKKIQCSSCFALTGTLIQNRLEEMWSILDFVQRGQAGTREQWREFAVTPIKRGHRHEGTAEEVVRGIMRLGVVYQKILPNFYLRRDKRLIAHELPSKRDMVVFCPLGDRQVIAYQALINSADVQSILRKDSKHEDPHANVQSYSHPPTGDDVREIILRNMNALYKVANHLALLYRAKDDSEHTSEVNRKLFKTCTGEDYDPRRHNVVTAALDPGNCGKWSVLEGLLHEWREAPSKNKVLIFSNSVRLLKMIAEFIDTSPASYKFDMITGEVGMDERMDMIDRFQDTEQDYFVLLISTLAGGVGLNLTAANKVVIFDPAWNPANDLQAMDRAFRIGQKRTVDVHRLIGRGTLEELMYERQIHKQQKARQINDGTFERRIHQGYEGGKTIDEKGDLFGIHNIFKFQPEGFMQGNLERIRVAEDQFLQDLIETEYDEEAEGPEMEEEEGTKMRDERRRRDLRKADDIARRRRDERSVLAEVLGEGTGQTNNDGRTDVLQTLGVSTHLHDAAFKDSPEERQIYEIGVRLLQSKPEMARHVKANDLGRLKKEVLVGQRKDSPSRKEEEVDDSEPWRKRFAIAKTRKTRAVLADLSD